MPMTEYLMLPAYMRAAYTAVHAQQGVRQY